VARSGLEALELFARYKNSIDLIILDMIMPGLSGSETYDSVKKIDPNIKVILSSGYSIEGQAAQILEKGCNAFIQKPFTINDLSAKIKEVLGED
jgi:CheY-like chemotaxis protein